MQSLRVFESDDDMVRDDVMVQDAYGPIIPSVRVSSIFYVIPHDHRLHTLPNMLANLEQSQKCRMIQR